MEQILSEFVGKLLTVNEIPCQQFDTEIPCDNWDWFDQGLRSRLLGDDSLKNLYDWFRRLQGNYLYLWTDPFQCSYIALNYPETTRWSLIGPILLEEIKGPRFDQLFLQLNLPERIRIPLQSHYYNIKLVSFYTTLESILHTAADYIYGKEQYKVVYLTDDDLLPLHRNFRRIQMNLNVPENPFLNVKHLESRYEIENALIHAVSDGNEALAQACMSKMHALMLPARMSSKLRDAKNYTITSNTLFRKAAETAGVHPYHIDQMSNSNIQQLEQMVSVEQCHQFQHKMIHNYCQLVKECNSKDFSMPIRKAVTYIHVDLSADLSLKSLAGLLNVNASYLSSLFKKETGMTLTEYVSNRRIDQARKLLRSTELPIQTIALRCGISDIYYFNRMFKRITGVTPKAYRENPE